MRPRLDHLRRCKRGRISKERRLRSRLSSSGTAPIEASRRSRPKSNPFDEGFAYAFRDYTTLSSYDVPITLSQDLANSEPVTSSLLLLDGSSLSPSFNGSGSELLRKTFHVGTSSKYPVEIVPSVGSEVTQPIKSPNDGQLELRVKAARNIPDLGRRLADKYSDKYVKRIHSIMRYSSSDSWRSSLSSFSSQASSLFSRFSVHKPTNGDEADGTFTGNAKSITPDRSRDFDYSKPLPSIPLPYTDILQPHNRSSAIIREDEITPKELQIWHELVDEGKLGPDALPQYLGVSPLHRNCCASSFLLNCGKCGFWRAHRIAIEGGEMGEFDRQYIDEADFYGNTALHCAAAAVLEDNFSKIQQMIWQGAHVTQCNTFGETFLRILCRHGPRTQKDTDCFVEIVRSVGPGFPFSKGDYHGRTILHVLFHNSRGHRYSGSFLRQIFDIMKPDIESKDNAGICVQDYLDDFGTGYSWEHRNMLYLYGTASFYFHLSRTHTLWQSPPTRRADLLKDWLDNITLLPQFIDAIDDAGDTSMLKLLKWWELFKRQDLDSLADESLKDAVLRMIPSGAVIHMRDRNGDTALAIASRRGFRLVVNLLLENGAIVHCRNYRGLGILRQTEQALALAKDAGDSALWSRIWSCQIALIDAGAIRDPTDEDEWRLPSTVHPPRKGTGSSV